MSKKTISVKDIDEIVVEFEDEQPKISGAADSPVMVDSRMYIDGKPVSRINFVMKGNS